MSPADFPEIMNAVLAALATGALVPPATAARVGVTLILEARQQVTSVSIPPSLGIRVVD